MKSFGLNILHFCLIHSFQIRCVKALSLSAVLLIITKTDFFLPLIHTEERPTLTLEKALIIMTIHWTHTHTCALHFVSQNTTSHEGNAATKPLLQHREFKFS